MINFNELPARMTLLKYPMLDRQRDILGVVLKMAPSLGVGIAGRRIRERRAAGEVPATTP